ncbi:MAG TPA: ABC transporter permease, partial [Gemmatimonadaceae bacterium]|nr:ABC transporter permease [Gemmatimonadaceae bacterium]
QSVFGGDTTVVGRTVRMSGTPIQIIGVMPPRFTFGGQEQFWTPFVLQPLLADVNRARKFHNMVGIARLRAGTTAERAESDLLAIAHRNEVAHAESNRGHLVTVVPLHSALVGDARVPLLVLAGAAACVLLIACANLGNLVFTRTLGRQREIAVRAALGAGRGRLVRQLLTESLILAVLGGMAGSAAGWAGTKALLSVAPDALPPVGDVRVDPIVILFAFAVSLGGGFLFGLVPAWMGAGANIEQTLRETGRSVAGRRSDRMRNLLVATQTALTVILLTGAGLLVRSLDRLQRVELGFDPQNVLVAEIGLPPKSYDDVAAARFFETLFERLRAMPGVRVVGAGTSVPLRGSWSAGLHIDGEPMPNGPLPTIGYTEVSDDYFRALSIPLRRGRTFEPHEVRGPGSRSVILNEEAVHRFWSDRDPLGARIQLGPNPKGPWYVVVGVVGNVKQDGFDAQARPIAYTSYRQEGEDHLMLAIRADGDPMRVVPTLRSAVRELDRTVPITGLTTMDSVAGDSLARRRFAMLLLSIFAVVSLVLAVVGTYGVTAYTVSARTPELGVRIALGATARDVLSLVVGRSALVSALGIAIGLAGALLSSRAIRGMLYGTSPWDAATFAAVAG